MQNAGTIYLKQSIAPNLELDLAFIGRILPILALIAAYTPSVMAAYRSLESMNFSSIGNYQGPFVKSLLLNFLGENGLFLFAPISGAIIALGVYKIIRAIGSSALIAGLGTLLSIAMTVFGISPNFVNSPDDALFAGFTLLSFASLLSSKGEFNPNALVFAFLYSTIACWFRPFAAWPILTVFAVAILVNRNFAGRPYYGLISALCWGPGLFLVSKIANFVNSSFAIGDYSKILDAQTLPQFPIIQSWGINLIPILVLFVLAVLAILLSLFDKTKIKPAVMCGIFTIASFATSAIYGSVVAGRYLLDNLLLATIIALISTIPDAIKKNSRLTIASGNN